MKAKANSSPITPNLFQPENLEAITSAITEAAERGRATVEANFKTWQDESSRFVEQMTAHGEAALKQLQACQSPLDVLAVEQSWLQARTQAYMDSGLRFAKVFASFAQDVGKPAKSAEAPSPPAPPAS